MKKAAVITIGDELITGLTTDTNGSYIAARLFDAGCETVSITSVGDAPERIRAALEAAAGNTVVVVTGGLGPTHDDITKKTAADFFQRSFAFREDIWEDIQRRFSRAGVPVASSNRSQAEIIEGAEVLANRRGTAPGMHVRFADTSYYFLPGVPGEMRALMDDEVVPRISGDASALPPLTLTLRTFGISESALYERVRGFLERFPDIRLAFLPRICGVDMRLVRMAGGDRGDEDRASLAEAERYLRERAGEAVYGSGDETLASAVADLLLGRGLSLATAESCTGGLISHLLTNIPGSSRWFSRGYVVYSNEAKISDLHVDPAILERHGAVSEETAAALAAGVRSRSSSDIGLGVTGIAGPGGAAAGKPVGLVCIGYADSGGTNVMRYHSRHEREGNKHCFALSALNFLRLQLRQH
ncbi:competence/damage-inducible protein A [bacterium]|nr:competence/damage-inducible protein A [bacterium]